MAVIGNRTQKLTKVKEELEKKLEEAQAQVVQYQQRSGDGMIYQTKLCMLIRLQALSTQLQ